MSLLHVDGEFVHLGLVSLLHVDGPVSLFPVDGLFGALRFRCPFLSHFRSKKVSDLKEVCEKSG